VEEESNAPSISGRGGVAVVVTLDETETEMIGGGRGGGGDRYSRSSPPQKKTPWKSIFAWLYALCIMFRPYVPTPQYWV